MKYTQNLTWQMKLMALAIVLLTGIGGWRVLQSGAEAREQQTSRLPLLVTTPITRSESLPVQVPSRINAPALAMATITVTNINDGAAPGPVGSLRRAINDAMPGDTINFNLPNPSTITLTNGNLYIDKSLTISGPGATALTIDGNSNERVFWLVNAPNVSISGLTITNGLDDFGAGINSQNSEVSINNCAIVGNHATSGAAGINIHTGSTATITNSTISGNVSDGQCGGVQVNKATATLTNCTISGNTGTVATGVLGLQISDPTTVTLINCTVANHSPHGVFTQAATIRLQNTLVANNAQNFVRTSGGTVTSLGNNLDSDGSSGLTNGANGDIVGTTGSPINALLSPLNNHGGPTSTLALLTGSPAINAGTNVSTPSTDQRGIARVGATDIGAFESRGFTLAIAGGNNQTAVVNTNFASPLSMTVMPNSAGEPVDGGLVTFTPPVSGATATIAGNPATIASGAATSGTVTANGTGGTYNVAANANGAASAVNFSLTNNVAPTVLQLVRGNASPTNTSSVTFNLLFSESVTNPMAGNFTLVPGGSVTGASITNVVCNMAFQSCVITVNSGTGSGTLGLNVTNSTGVIDSGGAGISNLPYTGQVYTIDKTEPTTSITANPTNPSASTTAGFTFTGTDTGGAGLAGFQCQLDGGGFSACTSPQTYTGLSQGSHTFQVRALDAVGNMDTSLATYTWVIDTVVPDTIITANPPNPSASANASFSFTGSDPGGSGVASFQCQIDGGGFSGCTSPRNYTGLSDGSHTFQVRAIDAASNIDSTPASFTWVIDTTVPTASLSASNVTMAGGTSYTFTVTYSDNTAINSASLDNSDVTVAGPSGPLAVTFASVTPSGNGTPLTASYSIIPPGGSWDNADGGTYTITMAASQVTDTTGNAVAASTLGTFQVLICPSVFTVNDLGDTADATPGNAICADSSGKCTLRAAVQEANAIVACSPLTINFSVTGTINLATGLPNLNHPNLTITGPGANQLTVQRSTTMGTPDFSVFVVNSGKVVNLSGLKVTNGRASFTGGAVFNNGGNVTIDACEFSANASTRDGGALTNQNGMLNVSNSTISNNVAATYGGGLLNI